MFTKTLLHHKLNDLAFYLDLNFLGGLERSHKSVDESRSLVRQFIILKKKETESYTSGLVIRGLFLSANSHFHIDKEGSKITIFSHI